MVIVEVQYFNGCPNSRTMINNVKAAISELEFNVNYIETLVRDQVDAVKTKFRGSPTLLVNGIDFKNLPEPEYHNLACRYYPNGVPDYNQIKNFIINKRTVNE
jgi:hypothetical protein